MGLIHMNGRIYDPVIGRFVQADSMVEDTFTTQGINRFAYVLNNPLSLTDPTGHLSWAEVRPFVAIAVAIALGPTGFLNGAWGAIGVNQTLSIILTGAISGAISSGSLKGAVIGAFSAGLNMGIGNITGIGAEGVEFLSGQHLASITLHSIKGGILAEIEGGKFGHGFMTAGLTESFSPVVAMVPTMPLQVLTSAVIGGTISVLGGGSFANGAGSAAFAMLFNHYSEKHPRDWTDQDWRDFRWDDSLRFMEYAVLKPLEYASNFTGGGSVSLIKWGSGALRASRTTASATLSRSAGFRVAKEKGGVPRSQLKPSSVSKERLRDQVGNVEGRVYHFERADGSTVTIREHTLGHVKGNHGPHFNTELRGVDGTKLPLKNDADSHTYIKP